MKKYFSKQFTQTIIGLSLAVVIGLGANFASAVWQGPSGNPTSGNPSNLLTTGFDQVKTGKLGVHTSEAVPNNIALKVNNDALAYTGINAQKGLLVNGFASIFGNAGLYGDTYVGPKQNLAQSPVKFQVTGRSALGTSAIVGSSAVLDTENQNKLVVAGSSVLGSVRVGGNEDINNSPGYALELRGTTNIGQGDKCTLNASDNDIGCPLGSFVQGVQYTEQDGPESVSVTCQYFEPAENQPINIGDCYAGPGAGANNPMNVTMTNSGAPSCNSGGLTILDVNSDSAPITGGNEPYTYTWYHQEIDGGDYPLNNPPTNGWGSPIATWNFSQLFVSVGTPSYYPNIDTHFWKVVVTDDSGDSDVAYYGAYDVLCN